jgi:hypothetical protein
MNGLFKFNIGYFKDQYLRKKPNQVKKKPFRVVFLIICIVSQMVAQKITPRLNQGALPEPQYKIINRAAQDLASYLYNWNVVHIRNKPLMYITYLGLREATSDRADGIKGDLMSHPGKFQIHQIGLSMTTNGTSSSHNEQDVTAGLCGKQIEIFKMGTEVANLVNEKKPVGDYSIDWNAAGLADGIYFCRMQAGTFSGTKKLVLQK